MASNGCGHPGSVAVRVQVPCPVLQPYVTFFYFVKADGPLTDFLYPEWGNVRFAVRGNWLVRMPGEYSTAPQIEGLFGPTDRHGEIVTGGGKTVGFGLTPLGWHRVFGGDASAMANRVEPLGHRLGTDPAALRVSLIADGDDEAASIARFETLLTALLAARPTADPLIVAIDAALRKRPATVEAFAALAGVAPRTLHRLCLCGFGFAPKRLLRRQRFLDTLGHVRSAVGGKLGASLDDDYFDQAHFYRDFRDFMAMTPRDYFSAPRRLMAEAAAAQVRAGVTLSFKLPPPPAASPADRSDNSNAAALNAA